MLGATVSQFKPWFSVTVGANVIAPPTLVTEIVCGLGGGPPEDCAKVKLFWDTASVAVGTI